MEEKKQSKPSTEEKKKSLAELLQDEDRFLDDHGPIIFGHRLRQPFLADQQDSED